MLSVVSYNKIMVIKELTDIKIYSEALHLATKIYIFTQNKTLKKEYSLTDQIKRAAVSVAANIAEGYGRKTKKDFTQFLSISLGSVNEIIAYLDFTTIAFTLDAKDLRNEYQVLAKRIYRFRSYLLTTDN